MEHGLEANEANRRHQQQKTDRFFNSVCHRDTFKLSDLKHKGVFIRNIDL